MKQLAECLLMQGGRTVILADLQPDQDQTNLRDHGGQFDDREQVTVSRLFPC